DCDGLDGETAVDSQPQGNPSICIDAQTAAKMIRFETHLGKYIKLQYGQDWRLRGARTLPFLLEKSRLVHQEHNERNYHVFYQLCKGVSRRSRARNIPEV
ncbi:unnamed protein product, partial [Laminaria digitata]